MSNKNFILIAAGYDFDGIWKMTYAGSGVILVAGNERYIAEGRIFKSTNNADGEWSLSHVDVNDHARIVCVCSDGAGVVYHATRGTGPWVYRSDDYGETWDDVGAVGLATSGPVIAIECFGSYVWVGGESHAYISTNSGASYSSFSSAAIKIFKYLGSGILLGLTSTSIYKSTNYGISGSWSLLHTVTSGHIITGFCNIDSAIWFYTTTYTVADTRIEGKIFKTTNGGTSFDSGTALYGSGAQGVEVNQIIYDAINEILFAGTSGVYERQWDGSEWNYIIISPCRIYKSIDIGATWELVTELQTVNQITDMLLDENNVLLVSGFGASPGNNAAGLIVKRHDQPLYLSPTEFLASGGKFDSSTKFPYKVSSGALYLHPTSETIFLNDRGFHYNLGSETYDMNSSLTDEATYETMKAIT